MTTEDREVWKRAVHLSADRYKGRRDANDHGFRDQLTRAALSVPSHTAEGLERASARACFHFPSDARGSCGAVRTQIDTQAQEGSSASEPGPGRRTRRQRSFAHRPLNPAPEKPPAP